jgi:hypothetical protein
MDNLLKKRNPDRDKTPSVPVYTLQLPVLRFDNRVRFLDIRQRQVVEPALRNKALFSENGCDVTLFHKDGDEQKFGTPLIHIMDMQQLFTLRAYGARAVQTLQCWQEWTSKTNPAWLKSAVISREEFALETDAGRAVYETDNYIPFSRCTAIGEYFIDAGKPHADSKQVLQSRLTGNLRTFLNNLGISDRGMNTLFEMQLYPRQPSDYPALKSKGEVIYKKSFHIRVETNLHLPLYFSLGQNVAYGCGIFKRVL